MRKDMKSLKPTFSVIVLIIANLVPLAGVLLFRWDAAVIVLLYWSENVIIGIYNILKMASLKVFSKASILELLFFIPFFCLHYGGFCAVHGFLILSIFNMGETTSLFHPDNSWPGPLVILQMLGSVIVSLWQKHPPGMAWPVACLFLSHGISFLQNFLSKKEYNDLNSQKLMIQPYKRIVVLHITVIAGALPIMMFGSPVPLLFVLVFLKTGMDIFLHMKEHRIDEKTGGVSAVTGP